LGGQYPGAAVPREWGFGRGIPSLIPRKFWDFFLRMVHFACILTHDYTVYNAHNKVKPAKSSDIVTKPCKVVIIQRIRNFIMTSANYFGN